MHRPAPKVVHGSRPAKANKGIRPPSNHMVSVTYDGINQEFTTLWRFYVGMVHCSMPLNASANTRTWVSVRLATSTASATREIKGWEDPSRGCASLGMENATMNGFDRNNVPPPVAGDASREVHKISEIPWSEVESSVKQARALRSAYVAAWLRKTIQSWASVFRRPGYMLPRPASRLRPSTQ